MPKNILTVVGITILLLGVVVTPMTLGYDDVSDILEVKETQSSVDNGGLMDSAWPMYCHDVRHTGRSPYSTVDTYELKWRFETKGSVEGSPVIDNNGIIYVGAHDFSAVYPNGTLRWKYDTFVIDSAAAIDENGIIYVGTVYADTNYLFAFYPDGSLKWKHHTSDISSSPVIADDGTIIFGDTGNYDIKALYPNGTLKWKYHTNDYVWSSPAIGEDGTVYCGSDDGYLYALYQNNGSLKWKYKTGDWVGRGPCIADDGTIYFGSWDGYLYAVYPDGSLKWKAGVGAGTTPVIAQDGTIYVGNRKLTAVYPNNGSIKWSFDPGPDNIFITGGNPCISADGIIYFGTHNFDDGTGEVIALNSDGTERWRFRMGPVRSAPAIGEDGTVYVGCSTTEDGYLNAFGIGYLEADANGPYYGLTNEPVQFEGYSKGGSPPHSYHWDFGDGNNSYEEDSTHIYSEPGNYTVLFTVTDNKSNTNSDTSWALIKETNNYPDEPVIAGPLGCPVKVEVCYIFHSTDPDGDDVKYLIDWGDDISNETEYFPSCTPVEVCHAWEEVDIYTCRVKAMDIWGAESDWKPFEVEVTNPRTRATTYLWYQWFLDRHPILERLLDLIRVI